MQKDTPEQWFINIIHKGLTSILPLRLEGTPPEDTVGATSSIWSRALWKGRVWNKDADSQRIGEAFRQLAISCSRWPSPSAFLELLPMRGTAPAQTVPAARQIEYQSPAQNKWWVGRNQEEMSYTELYSIPSWYLTANGERRLRRLMREMHPNPDNYRAEVMRRAKWETELARQDSQQQDGKKDKPADRAKMLERFNRAMAEFVKSPERIARLEQEKASGRVAWKKTDIYTEWVPCNSVAEILARFGVKV
jgi:hypothetical protein